MKVVCIIPARSGSKSIPNKNIQLVGGKPLIAYPVLVAKALGLPLAISTDSQEYMKIALDAYTGSTGKLEVDQIVTLIHRPRELAEDVGTELVVEHVLEKWEVAKDADIIVLMQPTTPFTTPETVKKCIEAIEKGSNSSISVRKVVEYPNWMITKDFEGKACLDVYGKPLARLLEEPLFAHETLIRQNLNDYYIPTGGCYAVKRGIFEKWRSLMVSPCKCIVVHRFEGIDIDEPEDLEIARMVKEKGLV